MTCGIYIMYFENTDKVYIGQSRDIEKRISQHTLLFKNRTASKKLMEAIDTFGLPKIEILEECPESDLDFLEEYYFKEFDSINNGFNTRSSATSGGINCYGDKNGRSKYTNKQIINVLFALIDTPHIKYEEIADNTGVSRSMVVDIACGNSHKWLAREYPEEYLILTKLLGKRSALKYGKIVSPEGQIFKVEHLSNFCREHNLDTGNISKLLRGILKSHKGWKLLPIDL